MKRGLWMRWEVEPMLITPIDIVNSTNWDWLMSSFSQSRIVSWITCIENQVWTLAVGPVLNTEYAFITIVNIDLWMYKSHDHYDPIFGQPPKARTFRCERQVLIYYKWPVHMLTGRCSSHARHFFDNIVKSHHRYQVINGRSIKSLVKILRNIWESRMLYWTIDCQVEGRSAIGLAAVCVWCCAKCCISQYQPMSQINNSGIMLPTCGLVQQSGILAMSCVQIQATFCRLLGRNSE